MGDDSATDMLTASMATGDQNAVEAFYRRYFDWLYAQARSFTRRDESFCLDVVQDAVLRVVRNVKRIDSEARFKAWLRIIVQTTALDHLRSERRREKHEAVPAELMSCDDFPYGLLDDEQHEWLEQQVKAFDPELIAIIDLRFKQRWTLARIGDLLGLSVGTVDGRLRRALKELRTRAMEEFEK